MNVLVTRGESSMAVIIDDVIEDKMQDEIEIHEATESSHEATETSHEATVKTEDELRSVNKGEENWYGHIFKIYSSENKKAVWLACEEKVSQVNCSIGIGVFSQYYSISIGIGCKNLVSVHH